MAYLFEYLLEQVPTIVVMGVIIYAQYRENRKADEYVREQDRKNLETLKDLSNLLERLIRDSEAHKQDVVKNVQDEAERTRREVDQRVKELALRVKSDKMVD